MYLFFFTINVSVMAASFQRDIPTVSPSVCSSSQE